MKRHAHPMVRRSHKKKRSNSPSERIVTHGSKGSTIIKIVKGKQGVFGSAPQGIKERANSLYNKGQYDAAASEYTMLIGIQPNDEINYGNRAACYLMMNNYERALKDAIKSVEINPNFIKGHARVIKSALAVHEFTDMMSSVEKLKEIDPGNKVLIFQSEKIAELVTHLKNEMQASAIKDYATALHHVNQSLQICPEFVDYKFKKAEYLIHLESFSEAEKIAKDVLNRDPRNSDALHVLGTCYYQTDIEKSVESFREAFRLSPDTNKNLKLLQRGESFLKKKSEGNAAYNAHNYTRAYECYLEGLQVDPQNFLMILTLFFNMAQASYKLGFPERCIQECNRTLALKSTHVKALMRRSQCYMDQKNYEMAIIDLENAERVDPSPDIRRMLQEARSLLERSKNDFHAILGVLESATLREVTEAYRKLTRMHHPDRHVNATEEVKKYHEIKCKEVTRAYRLLREQKGSNYCSNNNNFESQRKSYSPTRQEYQGWDYDTEEEGDWDDSGRYCGNCGSYEPCECFDDDHCWDDLQDDF